MSPAPPAPPDTDRTKVSRRYSPTCSRSRTACGRSPARAPRRARRPDRCCRARTGAPRRSSPRAPAARGSSPPCHTRRYASTRRAAPFRRSARGHPTALTTRGARPSIPGGPSAAKHNEPSRPPGTAVRLARRSRVPPLDRLTRTLVAIAAVSFLVIVLAYVLAPAAQAARALVADVSWTWTALYALLCSGMAARRHPERGRRRAWWWIGAACALFLGGQLVWNRYELLLGVAPPYPSLADVGFLGVYVCLLVGLARLLRTSRVRVFDVELLLDTTLVTLTAGALVYAFLLKPL